MTTISIINYATSFNCKDNPFMLRDSGLCNLRHTPPPLKNSLSLKTVISDIILVFSIQISLILRPP